MMSYDFQTTTYGKWILAGEHAVLRGHGALVFPIQEKQLCLSYQAAENELHASFSGCSGSDMHLLFWSVLEHGQQLLGKSLNHLSGHFSIYSDIPIGVGMGASAALCVAVARWFAAQNRLPPNELTPSFAKKLEHLFHGQSSGLDITGVASTEGMYFQQGTATPLKQNWRPNWFLSSCGQVGITSHCIQQVQTLWDKDPGYAAKIDETMHTSVIQAKQALAENRPDSFVKLSTAIQQAADCFQQWGLVSETLQQHMQMLRDAGAIAVKPTGSGSGGYVASLWEKTPPFLDGLLPI